MAVRRTICLTGIDVDVFNTLRDRPNFKEEVGAWVISALMGGVTVKETANLALYDIDIDTVQVEEGVESKEAKHIRLGLVNANLP